MRPGAWGGRYSVWVCGCVNVCWASRPTVCSTLLPTISWALRIVYCVVTYSRTILETTYVLSVLQLYRVHILSEPVFVFLKEFSTWKPPSSAACWAQPQPTSAKPPNQGEPDIRAGLFLPWPTLNVHTKIGYITPNKGETHTETLDC